MQHSGLIILTCLCLVQSTAAQYEKLTELKGPGIKVYYSPGHEKRTAVIAQRMDKALAYHRDLLDFDPGVTLLVLTAADWSTYTSFPVYGMPHYSNDKTLIVAAEDNPFWKSFLPDPGQLPPDLRQQVETVYRRADGSLSMESFFDLLALHELGHAFHFQGGLNMQRKWMGELFCNILLHTYIAENEPEQLPALTLFPRMVIAAGTSEFTYTSLQDIEERYEEIGQRHPKNYGWYQSRWHAAAGKIYDAAGKSVCRKLWDALKNNKETLGEEALLHYLESTTDQSISDMIRFWERDMVK